MSGYHSARWNIFVICGALTALGCVGTDTGQQGETGSLSLDLVLSNGVEIHEVAWQITGNGMDMSGDIDVSAPGSTASVEVFGLPPNDGLGDEEYVVELSAVSVDGDVTCRGSTPFDVEIGESTPVFVMLNCKLPQTLGGVRVNGEFNICAELAKMVVSPLRTSVGNDIDVSALGIDADHDPIKYIWSASGGSIADSNAASTTYTCEEIGVHEITVNVTDNDTYCRMAQWTVSVICVEGDGGDRCEDVTCEDDGNECTEESCNPANGECESDIVEDGTECRGGLGMCDNGECVDADKCEDVVCEDDNECTKNVCSPLDGECGYPPVDDGTDCEGGDGMCVDGTCIVDKCKGIICEPTLNDCTVGLCNTETGECDETNVPDSTPCNDGAGACSAGKCIDNNLCEGVDCTSADDCVQDGSCDPGDGMCIPGDNAPAGDPCDLPGLGDGVCDGAGSCGACNTPDDCIEVVGQCQVKTCIDNACGKEPIMDGTECDFGGTIADGICEDGECVEAPECVIPDQCDDGNVCTSEDCVLGACVYDPNDGAACDAGGGLPGLCKAGDCIGLCDDQDCTSTSQCVMDGTCDDQTGACIPGDNQPADTACTENGGTVCDGAGNCVECNDNAQCPGSEVCTDNVCMSGSVDYPPASAPLVVACTNNVTGDVSILGFDLTVDPGPMSPNLDFDADLSATGSFTESFLDAAQFVIPGGVRNANLQPPSAPEQGLQAAVSVRSGATGADVILLADLTSLDSRCTLTGVACTGAPGQGDCVNFGPPPAPRNVCSDGWADVPTLAGTDNTTNGCTQPTLGAPVGVCDTDLACTDDGTTCTTGADCTGTGAECRPRPCITSSDCASSQCRCDCSTCAALDNAGCRPGDPDVPCTKGDECRANGFCVTGDLVLPLASDSGTWTAGASGQDVLYGWFDNGGSPPTNANGTCSLPAASFPAPTAPIGVRVSAGGLFVAVQCLMCSDSGGTEGIAECDGGTNDGNACVAPFDNSNNQCVGGVDDGQPCSETSATACAGGECVNADCGMGADCLPPDLSSPTPDSVLIDFLVP